MAVKKREKCPGCGIAIGGDLEGTLVPYRGYRICLWCQENWQRKEKRLGRIIDFAEYTSGVKARETPTRRRNSLRNAETETRNAEIRKQKDKTPKELAELFHLTRKTIYRILWGKR